MNMAGWTRSLVKTKDHKLYRAYAARNDMRIHGVFRRAIESLLEAENLECVDGKMVIKTEA